MSSGLEGPAANLRALIEDVAALDELQFQKGWQVFLRIASQELDAYRGRLVAGSISDLNEYKLIAGRAQAIQSLLDLPAQVKQRLEQAQAADGPWSDEWVDSATGEEYALGDNDAA